MFDKKRIKKGLEDLRLVWAMAKPTIPYNYYKLIEKIKFHMKDKEGLIHFLKNKYFEFMSCFEFIGNEGQNTYNAYLKKDMETKYFYFKQKIRRILTDLRKIEESLKIKNLEKELIIKPQDKILIEEFISYYLLGIIMFLTEVDTKFKNKNLINFEEIKKEEKTLNNDFRKAFNEIKEVLEVLKAETDKLKKSQIQN